MTVVQAVPNQYTPDDLLAMPDGDRYELVDGELVERHMGWRSGWIGGRVHHFLSAFCDAHPLGWVVPSDVGYQCFPAAPSRVRRPDVSFIRIERLPAGQEPEGHCRIAPDLVVEVVSPNDTYSEVEAKVDEYIAAGVRLVWVINPPTRSARVHRADGTVSDLGEGGELDGEDVLPGFHCPLAEVFRTPGAPT